MWVRGGDCADLAEFTGLNHMMGSQEAGWTFKAG